MRKTRQIQVGNVAIGGGTPISVQSMTNTNTGDAEATLAQIRRLQAVGCQIVRSAVPAKNVLDSFQRICEESPLPVIADIHFDHTLAIESLRRGAACVRVNPGNLRQESYAREVARVAAEMGRAVRIGINMGSLQASCEEKYGRTADAMVASAMHYVDLFEQEGCRALKVSLKASNVRMTVEACRKFAAETDIPLHIGITEAGPVSTGIIKSAVGLGSLLLDGIGDTMRVSLTAPPEMEPPAAIRILEACGLRQAMPELVSCPTCSRTRIDLMNLVSQVEAEIERRKAAGIPIYAKRIAVMGCEVNGPGEAGDADIGIAGGANHTGILFRFGKRIAVVPAERLLETLLEEISRKP